MDKQTMRGDSIKFNNVRIQTARPFKKHINDMKDIPTQVDNQTFDDGSLEDLYSSMLDDFDDMDPIDDIDDMDSDDDL